VPFKDSDIYIILDLISIARGNQFDEVLSSRLYDLIGKQNFIVEEQFKYLFENKGNDVSTNFLQIANLEYLMRVQE
jgi:hypothetical protein